MNPYLFGIALTLLVYRAAKGKRLTPAGILAAIVTACIHVACTPFLFPSPPHLAKHSSRACIPGTFPSCC